MLVCWTVPHNDTLYYSCLNHTNISSTTWCKYSILYISSFHILVFRGGSCQSSVFPGLVNKLLSSCRKPQHADLTANTEHGVVSRKRKSKATGEWLNSSCPNKVFTWWSANRTLLTAVMLPGFYERL